MKTPKYFVPPHSQKILSTRKILSPPLFPFPCQITPPQGMALVMLVFLMVHHHPTVWAPGHGGCARSCVWDGHPHCGSAGRRCGGACTSSSVLSSPTRCFHTLHPVAQHLRVVQDNGSCLRPIAERATQTIRTVVPQHGPKWWCHP